MEELALGNHRVKHTRVALSAASDSKLPVVSHPAGSAWPAEDVPLPPSVYSLEESAAIAEVLFMADLVAQFSKPLRLKAVPFQDLLHLIEDKSGSVAESQDPIWDLYLGLLSQTAKARPCACLLAGFYTAVRNSYRLVNCS